MHTRILVALVLIAGCRNPEPTTPDRSETTPEIEAPSPGVIGTDAVVRFVNVEGGCWRLDVGSTHYEPLNLPAAFKTDGKPVRVAMRTATDVGSLCMVGTLVYVDSISPR